MPQLGFGLDTNTTFQETGYDQYKKRDDFAITPTTILIGLAIIIIFIGLKKTFSNNKFQSDNINITNHHEDDISSLAKELHATFHSICDILENNNQPLDRDSLVKSLKSVNPEIDNTFHNLRVISIPMNSNSLVAQIEHIGGSAMHFKEFNFTITGIYEYSGLSLIFNHKNKKRDISVVNVSEELGLDPKKYPEASVGAEAQKLYQYIIAINGGDRIT